MSAIDAEIGRYQTFLYQLVRSSLEAGVTAAAAAVLEKTHKDTGNAMANWYVESHGLKGGVGLSPQPFAMKHGKEGVSTKENTAVRTPEQAYLFRYATLSKQVHEAIWRKNQARFFLGNEVPEEGGYHRNARVDGLDALAVSKAVAAATNRKASIIASGMGFDWSEERRPDV